MPYARFIPVLFGEGETNKSEVDMSDGILFDDRVANLINSNAKTKVCFGDIYSWNRNWDGIRCANWHDVEKFLREEELKDD
jgi:hypothetical protein